MAGRLLRSSVTVGYDNLSDAWEKLSASRSRSVVVTCEHVDVLRSLAIPGPRTTSFRDVTFVIPRWTRPMAEWQGRVGPMPGLVRIDLELPHRTGEAKVRLGSLHNRSLAVFARAAYRALQPSRPTPGLAIPEVVTVDALPPRALGAFVEPAPLTLLDTKEPFLLEGVRLPRVDVAVTHDADAGAEIMATAEDPAKIKAARVDVLHASGAPAAQVTDAGPRPQVDLHVHRPTGWLLNFQDPIATVRTIDWADRGDRLEIDLDRSDEPLAPVRIPLSRPVSALDVDLLHLAEQISLADLTLDGDPTRARQLEERLVEISATGVILHSLPADQRERLQTVTPELADLWKAPYRPSTGLARDHRSVTQRNLAMHRHSSVLGLAATEGPHRAHAVPAVSLVMSSMRPDRVRKTLLDLDAQTYPNLEIVLVGHGQPIPEEIRTLEFSNPVRFVEVAPTVPFGTALATGARHSSGDLVMKVDDDDLYGPEFVWDIVLAYLYSSANIVGKTTEYMFVEGIDQTFHRRFAAERYSRQVAGGAMLMSRADLEAVGGWRPTTNSTDRSVQLRFFREGMIGYRTSSLGYVYVRHDDGHTWHQDMGSLIKNAFEQWAGLPSDIYPGRQATFH